MATYRTNFQFGVTGNAESKLKGIRSTYEDLKRLSDTKFDVKANTTQASEKLNQIEREKKTASKDTSTTMKFHETGLAGIRTGFDHVKNGSSSLRKSIGGVNSALSTLGFAGVASLGLVAAAVGKGIKTATDLQDSYKRTENLLITGGENAKQSIADVNQMQKDGKDYSLEYGKSQTSIADAYQDLTKRGYSSKQALGAMKSELQASVASGDEFSDVVKVSSQTLEAFGMKTDSVKGMIKNTKTVVNDLAYAADMTATDFSDMGVAMEYVGASAHTAGYSLSETSSAIGILSNNGLEADKAGTGLRKVLTSLASPTATAKSAIENLGLSMDDFKKKDGSMKSISDSMSILHDKMQGMGKADQIDLMKKIFGTTGEQAALILADNADKLDKLNQKVKESADNDYVEKLAKKNSETVKMQSERAKQAITLFDQEVGLAFLPAINEVSQTLAKGLSSKGATKEINDLSDSLKKVADKGAKYLVDHGSELISIVKSIGTIGGELAKGAWDSFATVISLITGHGFSDGADSTTTIANALKKIASHKEEIEAVGAVFGTYFIGSKLVLAGKGVAEIYQGLKLIAGISFANLETLNTLTTATGAKDAIGQIGTALGGVQGKLGTALNSNLGKITVGIAFAYNFADVVKDIGVAFGKGGTVDEKFKSIGQVSGFGIGTGIGMFFGGPAGAALGGTIGKFIGKYVGETVEDLQKKYSSDNASNSDMASSGGKKTYTETTRKGAGIKDSDSTSTKIIKGAEFGLSNAGMALNARALMNTASKIFGNGAGWKKSIGKSLGQIDTSFSKWVSGFGKSAKKTWQKITKSSLAINSPRWNDITKSFNKWVGGFTKSAKKTWEKGTKKMLSVKAPSWNDISKSFDKWFKGFGKTWDKSWNKLGDFGSTISRSASKSWNDITKSFTKWQGGFKKTWDKDWSKLADFGDGIKKGASDTWSDITKSLGKWYKGFSKDWDKDWNELGNYLSGKTGDMRQTLNGWGSGVDKWWKKFSTGFGKSWNSCWQSASDFFGNIFGGIANTAKSAMNGVIGVLNGGIGGIDSVIHTFGGSKSAIPKIHKLANGTTNGQLDKDTLAVLNDGNDSPETNNREMVRKANGQSYLVNGINTLAKLDKGDTVYSASQTRDLLGLRHFAGGSILDTVSGAVDWAGDKLGDAEKYLGDKMEAIKKFIKDPVKAVTGVFDKTIGSLAGNAELIKDLAPAEGHWMIGKGKKWFEDLFKKLNTEFENPGGSGVERWRSIIEAIGEQMGGLSSGQVNKLLKQISTESGGNPTIKQGISDINSQQGHPAQGLLQFIPSTFAHWATAGHGDILNGADQIRAAINALNHGGEGGWGNIGLGHGWAEGGHVLTPQISPIAEDGDEYVINPRKPNALNLAVSAMRDIARNNPVSLGSNKYGQSHFKPVTTVTQAQSSTDEDGNSLVSIMAQVAENTKKLLDKNSDIYMDSDKVTKKVNQTGNRQMNILGYQLN